MYFFGEKHIHIYSLSVHKLCKNSIAFDIHLSERRLYEIYTLKNLFFICIGKLKRMFLFFFQSIIHIICNTLFKIWNLCSGVSNNIQTIRMPVEGSTYLIKTFIVIVYIVYIYTYMHIYTMLPLAAGF